MHAFAFELKLDFKNLTAANIQSLQNREKDQKLKMFRFHSLKDLKSKN